MSNNTSPAARDERVEMFEEGLDSPLPSSVPNEADVDVDGRGVAVLEDANLRPPSIAEDEAVAVDNPSLATDGSSPMALAASRPGPDLINDSDGPPLPFVIMASMLETTKGMGENNRANARRPAGIEEIDNDVEPLPAAANALRMMLETTKGTGEHNRANARRPAGIEEVDNDGGPLPAVDMTSSLFDIRASNKVSTNNQELVAGNTGLQSINDIGKPTELLPPAPFNPFMFEDHAGDNKFPASQVQQHNSAVVDHEDDEEAPQVMEEDDINSTGTIDLGVYGDVEEQINPANVNDDSDENGIPFRRESSIPGITEAYPVDDNIIIAIRAEPTLPWRKQRRTKILIVFVFVLVVMAVSAIAVGVYLSSSTTKTVTELIAISSPPSTSTIPTFEPTTGRPSMPPTDSPSSSQIPSTSPSSCSYTISTNMQKLDLLHPDPGSPKTAIDGRNLVVVWRDITSVSRGCNGSTGSLYVIFYSLSDDNVWERVGFFIKGDTNWGSGYGGDTYDVALSGKTAIVGLPSEYVVNIYEQNGSGLWEEVDSLQDSSYFAYGFGQSVDIDGDLMVVAGYWYLRTCGGSNCGTNPVHVFKKTGGEWLEIAVLENHNDYASIGKCFVNGNTIVISDGYGSCWENGTRGICEGNFIQLYKYDQDDDSVLPLQRLDSINPWINDFTRPFNDDPIRAINGDHLVYYNTSGVFIYHNTQDADEPFTLVQYLKSSDYGESFGRTLTMEEGIMVVGGVNRTHFFSQQNNEVWEEVLTLDQSYDHYQISGRTLIVANQNEVFAMNIADCTQPIPTQMPSVSLAPTACYSVDFEYSYSGYDETPWGYLEATIQRIESDVVVVKAWPRIYGDTLCLNQGRYQFTLYADSSRTWYPPGLHYSVKSNGWVIAQGALDIGQWGFPKQQYLFDIPFDPTTATAPTGRPYTNPPGRPTNSPTSSQIPSSSLPPTQIPSSSLSPSLHPTSSQIPSSSLFPSLHPSPTPTSYPTATPNPTPTRGNGPMARDDEMSVSSYEGNAFISGNTFISVLDNDVHAPGEDLVVQSIVTDASNGECTISLSLIEVVYAPNVGFVGMDSCVYEACDSTLKCDTAMLSIEVTDSTPTNPLTPTTLFPTETTPPTPSPVSDTGGFQCPDPSFVGCTAVDPSNPEDECPTVGEPCPNDNDGEFCCQDGCPRNYCTAKQALPSPPTPPTTLSPTFPFPTPFPTSLQPSTRPSISTTIKPSDQEPASSITPIKACLMQSECEEQSQMMGFVNFYAGSYADYGCFSKGDNLYWGNGGSDAQKAISPLGGVKERVWCD